MLGTLSILLILVGTPDIPDPASLTAAQRSVYQSVIGEEFCSCKSSLTIGGCLELKKDCATARHLGDMVYNAAQVGSTADEILGFLSERVMGSFCGRKSKFDLKNVPSKGKKGAKIQLVEFADFRCGHCRAAAEKIKEALKFHGNQSRYSFYRSLWGPIPSPCPQPKRPWLHMPRVNSGKCMTCSSKIRRTASNDLNCSRMQKKLISI